MATSFRELAEKSVQGITVYQNRQLVYINAAMAEIHGYSVAELSAMSVEQLVGLVHPDDRAMAGERARKRLAGEPLEPHVELRLLHKNGGVRWIRSYNNSVEFEGQPAILATAVDITERKRALDSAALFRALVDRASDAIFVLDPATTQILDANDQGYTGMGYTRDELIGQPISVISNGDAPALGDELMFEATYRRKDGTTYPVEVRTSHVTLDRDYIVAVARDISRRKRGQQALRDSEERLRHAQKMEAVGRLAAGVAHDFNNLLAIIMLQLRIVHDGVAGSPAAREAAHHIAAATDRAARLTRQMLLLSRQRAMERRFVELNELVANLVTMLARVIGEDVRVHFHPVATPLVVHADAGMIDQLALNLAVNARDAMPHGGELSIETGLQRIERDGHPPAPAGHYAWLRVTDTGIGIAPDILPHIFEPFFTTKQAGQGTGLGLATVLGIAEQHGGWVDVASEPGRGASFQVFLPAHETVAERVAPLAPARGGDETILVVEDDVAVRSAIRTTLEHHGHRVLDARDGAHALELWGRHGDAIALVLTDLVLPDGTSGVELALRLQAESPAVRVVFMSGYGADAGTSTHVRLREGDNFAQKPFSSDQLLAVIRRQLDAS